LEEGVRVDDEQVYDKLNEIDYFERFIQEIEGIVKKQVRYCKKYPRSSDKSLLFRAKRGILPFQGKILHTLRVFRMTT
jgi:hypothetical protein